MKNMSKHKINNYNAVFLTLKRIKMIYFVFKIYYNKWVFETSIFFSIMWRLHIFTLKLILTFNSDE